MKNIKTFPKIILFISMLSGTIWFGSYLTRLVISYQIFEGTDFTLRTYLTPGNLNPVFQTIVPGIITGVISFPVFLISFILFLFTSKVSLKQNGWLFITTVLVFLTAPFELYLSTIDYKIIGLVYTTGFDGLEVLNLVIERFKILSSFPVIELLCYASVIFLLIFKPLQKTSEIIEL